MANLAGFSEKQYAFAAHIRNPDTNPKPDDVDTRRMQIYNDLFYNNVEGFMANSFPVLREICDDQSWHQLIRDYLQHHKAKTPLFPEMPREFLTYLEQERGENKNDFPFMLELAHYEWAELALSLSEQEPDWSTINQNGDLLTGLPVLSPLAWPLHYQWPVQLIGPDFLPDQPLANPNYLLLYRDTEDEVHFMELNPVTARLLHLISEALLPDSKAILLQIAKELGHSDPQIVVQGGHSILQDLSTRGVILGTQN